MRQYLATIHTRSDKHKKRFALLTSGGFTLFIFIIWSLVKFSPFGSDSNAVVANEVNVPTNTANAISPLDNISSGISASFQALKDQFTSLKGNVQSVNLQGQYNEMRTDAINNQTNQ